jgi:hypothetical protein
MSPKSPQLTGIVKVSDSPTEGERYTAEIQSLLLRAAMFADGENLS